MSQEKQALVTGLVALRTAIAALDSGATKTACIAAETLVIKALATITGMPLRDGYELTAHS